MAQLVRRIISRFTRNGIEHSIRTAVAGMVSLFAAGFLGLPEPYWASITTLIVAQSALGTAWTVSIQRFFGTALGASLGAILTVYFGASLLAFGSGIFVLGLMCLLLGLERSGYRYSSITLAVIMLITRSHPVWVIAIHRFVEVSVGIVIGLILTALWPGREDVSNVRTLRGR
ncbi:MAG: FUSC family protein [Acidobacteriota bacterium]|jgi:uncharacterized membrane protein YgaE (UPF0421/DUF939 family)